MSLEDPFFVVRDEVVKALTKARVHYQRWLDFQDDPNCGTKEELESTTTELRNGLRSIEWDLEDLEETIGIVESNPKKFRLDENEISNRRKFITLTKDEVKFMREKLFDSRASKDKKMMLRQGGGLAPTIGTINGPKYSRLDNSFDSKIHNNQVGLPIEEDPLRHNLVVKSQNNETLDKISEGVSTLSNNNRQIRNDVDEHAVMLDEAGHDLDLSDSRFNSSLKKVALALQINNGRRQYLTLGAVASVLFFIAIIVLF